MRITRIELENFRCFKHIELENLPELIVLASRNGHGKSSLLDAIVAAKELTQPYHEDTWSLNEHTKTGSFLKWPSHMRSPLRIGSKKGFIKITFMPTADEVAYVNAPDLIKGFEVSLSIQENNLIKQLNPSEPIRKLLRYNSQVKNGYLDYISSIRHYPNSTISDIQGPLSDISTMRAMSDITRTNHEYYETKWKGFKPFIMTRAASDSSHRNRTGEDRDSLKAFKHAFDFLFHPKTFIGIDDTNGLPDVYVNSLNTTLSVDNLSDGEKEILYILCHMYRFRESENMVLWDTPEAHLNAILEKKIIAASKIVAPLNQLIVATHSPDIIESVPLESIYILEEDIDGATCKPLKSTLRGSKANLYRNLGASVAIQIAANRIVFVEGKNKNSDKSTLESIFSESLSGCVFVAAQDCNNVTSSHQKAIAILNEIESNTNIKAIIDRDYRTAEQVSAMQSRTPNVFIWPVHELENIFLNPIVAQLTLKSLGENITIDRIEGLLKEAAISLTDWTAADWTAWEIENAIKSPKRQIGTTSPRADLNNYQTQWKESIDSIIEQYQVDEKYITHQSEIRAAIEDGTYLNIMPGKQLLWAFLQSINATFQKQHYISVASSLIARNACTSTVVTELRLFLQKS